MDDFTKVTWLVTDFQRRLNVILMREGRRHMMDMHLPFDVLNAIEDDLVPALQQVMTRIEWEPSDADLCPGEPPVTAQERFQAAWKKHIEMHS